VGQTGERERHRLAGAHAGSLPDDIDLTLGRHLAPLHHVRRRDGHVAHLLRHHRDLLEHDRHALLDRDHRAIVGNRIRKLNGRRSRREGTGNGDAPPFRACARVGALQQRDVAAVRRRLEHDWFAHGDRRGRGVHDLQDAEDVERGVPDLEHESRSLAEANAPIARRAGIGIDRGARGRRVPGRDEQHPHPAGVRHDELLRFQPLAGDSGDCLHASARSQPAELHPACLVRGRPPGSAIAE
jgi:hypothetical protein